MWVKLNFSFGGPGYLLASSSNAKAEVSPPVHNPTKSQTSPGQGRIAAWFWVDLGAYLLSAPSREGAKESTMVCHPCAPGKVKSSVHLKHEFAYVSA